MKRVLASIAAFLVVAALGVGAWWGYDAVVGRPFERVVFAGDVERLPPAELEALAQAIRRSPAGASLEAVREAARRVPWVREANVRRQFPDAVEITFRAHEAFAYWNEDALVSTTGEVFVAQASRPMPRLRGPDGSGPRMIDHFGAISAALAPLGTPVAELRLSPRGAWVAVLESGLTLQLGRGDVLPRLERFVAAWKKLGREQEPSLVDLRYPNGFAVRKAATLDVGK